MAKLRLEAHLRPLTPQPDAGAVGDLRGFRMSLDEQQQGQRVACVQVLRDVMLLHSQKFLFCRFGRCGQQIFDRRAEVYTVCIFQESWKRGWIARKSVSVLLPGLGHSEVLSTASRRTTARDCLSASTREPRVIGRSFASYLDRPVDSHVEKRGGQRPRNADEHVRY